MISLNTWETFLRVAWPADLPPDADAAWLISKAIEPESPAVLRQLRDQVLPLIRQWQAGNLLDWYSFLIHDHGSGVPTTSDDKSLYIHLRLAFIPSGMVPFFPPEWVMTRKIELSREIAGVNPAAFDVDKAWRLLGDQSEWLLSLIEAHGEKVDGLVLVKHVRQFLHFYANMAQMKVT